MRTAITLERVETDQGVVKIEGKVCGVEFVVEKLWAMSTDGWEEIDPICPWTKTMLNSNIDILIERTNNIYGSTQQPVTRVAG
ncbi:MAG: hypothetical protein V3U65_04630 [Granulosicoccaceae bacterium]